MQPKQISKLVFEKPAPALYVRISGYIFFFAAAVCALIFLAIARSENKFWGFPLDDPWIHLCFARNLVEFGSFSYFRDQLVTSGSTSPLYTALLAALYVFSKNEFIISYILGILFFCLSALAFFKLACRDFYSGAAAGAAAALLLALQPRLALIAVSGMETTLFIFIIIGALYFYKTAGSRGMGIMLGLVLWCRPDGIILWVAIAADYLLQRLLRDDSDAARTSMRTDKGMMTAFAIALIMAAAYGVFNYTLSGELFPNTYKAKLTYYGAAPWQLFLQRDVLAYFSSRELFPLSLFFCIGAGCSIYALLRGRYRPFHIYLIFFCGFVAAYCLRLPFAHRFGRYMMPLIPCYIMLSLAGLGAAAAGTARLFKKDIAGNMLWCACVAAALMTACSSINGYAREYAHFCKYHNDRHVAAGKWIDAHLPQEAFIATHDIGAIAYYGKRKILDMVGLVTPEIIPHIRDEQFNTYLEQYLNRNKITHIAVLTSWLEIVNSNSLFSPVNSPEIIEVHAYAPGKTHIQSHAVSAYNNEAIRLAIQQKNYEPALKLLEQARSMDAASSQTLLYLGAVYEMSGRPEMAEQYYHKALAIFPEYPEAHYGLARLYFKQGRSQEARAAAEKCLAASPEFQPARDLLQEINRQPKLP